MRKREDFVGAIMQFDGSEDIYLAEFLGEGNAGVVYRVASVATGDSKHVIKFHKGLAWLEMNVLHHSLRIHEAAFPAHPLAMQPAERFAALTLEMLERVDSPRLVFRIEPYVEILSQTLEVLGRLYGDAFLSGTLAGDFFAEMPIVRQFIDENLVAIITEGLDDENIAEHGIPFFTHLRDEIPPWIERQRVAGAFRPVSRNPLCALLGLLLEDFISADELRHICAQPEFVARSRPGDLDGLLLLARTLAERADSSIPADDGSDDESRGRRAALKRRAQAIAALEVVEQLASTEPWQNESAAAQAMAYRGHILALLAEERGEATKVLQQAVQCGRDSENLHACREALIDLADLLEDEGARYSCIVEIKRVEDQLDLPDEQRAVRPAP